LVYADRRSRARFLVDFQLYIRVLWRFRYLVGAGFALAVSLAVLSVVRIDPGGKPTFKYREDEQWASFSMLFVTQQGYTWARLSSATEAATGAGKVNFESDARFSSLAVLYAYLASSDPVRKLMRQDGPVDGEIAAEPVLSSGTFSSPLPLMRLIAIAKTPEESHALVIRATDAFRKFLTTEQARRKIPEDQRVLMTVLRRADKPELLAGRSMTLPIVVFMGVMILVSGLAFVLENMLGRGRKEAAASEHKESPVGVARDAA
jgi:hypothetical protein